jgi:hypothetical protein
MKVLALTATPVSARELRDALPADVNLDSVEVLIVAPALQSSPLRFWVSDADEAIGRASEVWRRSVASLDEAGISASGDTGESDPLDAIEDAMQTFKPDRIVLFTHAERDDARYREDVDPDEVRARFDVPVDHATPSHSSA